MMDDDDAFFAAMGKVTPLLQQKEYIVPNPKKTKPHDIIAQREQHEYNAPATTLNHHQHTTVANDQEERWVLRANGVSATVIRRLAAGQPPIARSLDLHGQYREPALCQLQQAIAQACKNGQRVLRVIHGRGMHSSDKPVLKQAVYHDLQYGSCASCVLAAIPEPTSQGGACLVLLRRKK